MEKPLISVIGFFHSDLPLGAPHAMGNGHKAKSFRFRCGNRSKQQQVASALRGLLVKVLDLGQIGFQLLNAVGAAGVGGQE